MALKTKNQILQEQANILRWNFYNSQRVLRNWHHEDENEYKNKYAQKVLSDAYDAFFYISASAALQLQDFMREHPEYFFEKEIEVVEDAYSRKLDYISEDASGYAYLYYVTVYYHLTDDREYTPEYFQDELKELYPED